MRRLMSVLAVLVLGACEPMPMPGASPGAAPAALARIAAPSPGFESLLNAQRAAAGLPAAQADSRLQAAAERHLADMLDNGFFSHRGSDGSRMADRIAQAGFASCRPGENIADGAADAATVMQMWMGSGGHRDNILMAGQVGYGLAQSGGKWVLTIAAPC